MILALVAGWSCAEALLFFIVVDVPLSFIALMAGLRKALLAAFVAALAAMPGASIMHTWAAHEPATLRKLLSALPAIDDALIESSGAAYAVSPLRATLAGSFTGVPFKLYAYAAGARGDAAWPLLVATPLLRLPRFLMTILLTVSVSRLLPRAVSSRARLQLLSVVWVVFYTCYFIAR